MLETTPAADALRSFGLALLASVLPSGDQSAEAQFLRSCGPIREDGRTPGERLDACLANPSAGDRLLLQLGDQLGLSRIELLATAIAACVETDIMCGRAVAHLQAPVGGSRPTFALLTAALNGFGDAGDVIAAILTGAGVESGLLQVLNDGAPLAERALSVPVPLCLADCRADRKTHWCCAADRRPRRRPSPAKSRNRSGAGRCWSSLTRAGPHTGRRASAPGCC
jgi:hypothetical protein